MTDQPTNVITALSAVMAELPGIGKDKQAPAGQGGYAYRGIDQITLAAQPLLAKHGVIIAPYRIKNRERIDIIVAGKPWTDERMDVTYRVYGPGGPDDYIEIECPAIGRDNSDKGANKCMTQAFKYALLQALCIADSKDDADQASYEADMTPVPESGDDPASRERIATIRELTHRLREEGDEVTTQYDDGTIAVLDTMLLIRDGDGPLYPGITNAEADDLIEALGARVSAGGTETTQEPGETPSAGEIAIGKDKPDPSEAPFPPCADDAAETPEPSPEQASIDRITKFTAHVKTLKLSEVRAQADAQGIDITQPPEQIRAALVDALVGMAEVGAQ